MAIIQNLCLSYKKEILEGLHQSTHQYKIALFTKEANLTKHTKSYIGLDYEVSNVGTGYTIGGIVLTGFSVSLINDIAILDFINDPFWTNVSFIARGAIIYNNSLVNKNTIAILDFGSDYTCANGTFSIILPAPGEATALIRIV